MTTLDYTATQNEIECVGSIINILNDISLLDAFRKSKLRKIDVGRIEVICEVLAKSILEELLSHPCYQANKETYEPKIVKELIETKGRKEMRTILKRLNGEFVYLLAADKFDLVGTFDAVHLIIRRIEV